MSKPPSTPTQQANYLQSLKVVPIHNPTVKMMQTGNPDEIEIEVQLAYEGAFMKRFQKTFKTSQKKRYILDGIGKRIYTSIDGKKTFEQIIDEFAERDKLSFFESRTLLGQYFQTLSRRGIIVASLPK